MKKTVFGMLVMTLLITMTLSIVIPAEENTMNGATHALSTRSEEKYPLGTEDILDQNNSYITGSMMIDIAKTWLYAQSFTPTLSILTRVEVSLVKKGNGGWRTYTLDIRDTLNGSNFTYVTKTIYYFPYDSNWIEFDFPDINVVPGQTYYMVCTPGGDLHSLTWWIKWNYGDPDPYARGDGWVDDNGWNILAPDGNPSDFCFKTYGIDLPPRKPDTPRGSPRGTAGHLYNYTTSADDPDGHQIWYFFDWGDGNNSGWIGPYSSGDTAQASYTWGIEGNYSIQVKAKDEYDSESEWSDPLVVSMPKHKTFDTPFLRYVTRYPYVIQILRHLLGR